MKGMTLNKYCHKSGGSGNNAYTLGSRSLEKKPHGVERVKKLNPANTTGKRGGRN